jgi:hypothetical protein
MPDTEHLFNHNLTLAPPDTVQKAALDSNFTYPYRVSLARIDQFPIADFGNCGHLEFRFNFFDRVSASFFGNTFTAEFIQDAFLQGSMASLSGLGGQMNKYSSSLNKKVGNTM